MVKTIARATETLQIRAIGHPGRKHQQTASTCLAQLHQEGLSAPNFDRSWWSRAEQSSTWSEASVVHAVKTTFLLTSQFGSSPVAKWRQPRYCPSLSKWSREERPSLPFRYGYCGRRYRRFLFSLPQINVLLLTHVSNHLLPIIISVSQPKWLSGRYVTPTGLIKRSRLHCCLNISPFTLLFPSGFAQKESTRLSWRKGSSAMRQHSEAQEHLRHHESWWILHEIVSSQDNVCPTSKSNFVIIEKSWMADCSDS